MLTAIDQVLSTSGVGVQRFGIVAEAQLFAEEQEYIATASVARQNEFAGGRHCARLALAELGISPVPLLPGPDRYPQWPAGIIGSITHCPGYQAAAVAHHTTTRSLGIDAELNQPISPAAQQRIGSVTEIATARSLRTARPGVSWDRLLFSAKESIFKAWFPLTHQFLGFGDVEVSLQVNGTFTAHISTASRADHSWFARANGRWVADSRFVLTCFAVPAG